MGRYDRPAPLRLSFMVRRYPETGRACFAL